MMFLRPVCVLAFLATVVGAWAADWPQWLGPDRNMVTPDVPTKLPEKKVVWQKAMAGECHGGIAVVGNFVVVPDHAGGKDIVRCFSADKGEELWTHSYEAKAEEMQFGSCMRATPLIREKKVYTFGALGELCCLELEKATPDKKAIVVWRRNLAEDYGATPPEWGYSASPLIADGLLFVAPGAAAAAVVALGPLTGKEKWKTAGEPAAYGSFAMLSLGGVRQLVGYDKVSLGGWDPKDGKRLWAIKPEIDSDFNVGTPQTTAPDMLFVCTENNGARLYKFGKDGKPAAPGHVAMSEDLMLDMATPALWKDRLYGTRGGLYVLAANDALKTVFSIEEDSGFSGYASYIVGNDRLLAFMEKGTLYVLDVAAKEAKVLGKLQLSEKTWSHPALANGRFFVRDAKTLFCYDMPGR